MTNPTNDNQMCIVTVAFPVANDDEAIAIKKEIAAVIAKIENSRIDFRLTENRQSHG